MAYKKSTVDKLVATMKAVFNVWRERIQKGEHVKASISAGNDKIGKALNVSFAPILSCGNCEHCMYDCYAVKNLVRRGMVVINAWVKNWTLFSIDRDEFFRQVREKCKRRRTNKFLRWHVSGDIVDRDHFERMNAVAHDFTDFRAWTYTEMFHVVNSFCDEYGRDAVADNFNVMFSDWSMISGVKVPNPYGFKRFIVVPETLPEEKRPKGFYCPGNCDFCKKHKCGCVYGKTDVYCIRH